MQCYTQLILIKVFTFHNEGDLKLSDEERQDTDRELTLEELTVVLNHMQTGKMPGPDGISTA